MTTETLLTDEEIITIGHLARAIEPGGNGYILPVTFARAIEQAVLQSPEVQALRKDAERLRVVLKEAAAELDCLGSEIDRIHRENPSIVTTLPASNVLSMARDAAMEQQP